jgi:hypothetical protein
MARSGVEMSIESTNDPLTAMRIPSGELFRCRKRGYTDGLRLRLGATELRQFKIEGYRTVAVHRARGVRVGYQI